MKVGVKLVSLGADTHVYLNFDSMFKLFNRAGQVEREIKLLTKILEKLPAENILLRQLEAGLMRRVRRDPSMNFVGFSYHPSIVGQFEDLKAPVYSMEGIKVFDKLSADFATVELHVGYGLIIGYSIDRKKFELDDANIDTSNARKRFEINSDFKTIKGKLSKEEIALINPSEVYLVKVGDIDLFHLMDICDGDFIGVSNSGKFYRVTHDPFALEELQEKLSEIILKYRTGQGSDC